MMNISKLNLMRAVELLITQEDKAGAITEEVRQNMTLSLVDFVEASIIKFAKGQAEHGGDIRQRDLKLEKRMEQIDLFWYESADNWPKQPFEGDKNE